MPIHIAAAAYWARLRLGHPWAPAGSCQRVVWLWGVLLVVLLAAGGVRAESPLGGGGTFDPTQVFIGSYGVAEMSSDASGDATSSVGGGTFDVNAFLGANRYYDHATPITGQNTITTNLEAGFFWNGHETLQHVATNTTNFIADASSWGGASIPDKYDRHATWVAMLIGGRATAGGDAVKQQGLAYGTDLRSGAIASSWVSPAYALSFNLNLNSFLDPYERSFGVADVVNSSWGFTDPSGTAEDLSIVMDAYSFQNPTTTFVVSAGNAGPGANTVGSPGSGYNAITVAALSGANGYDAVASFSSRGPQDFGYRDALNQTVTVAGVRAAVDIAAPGALLVSAFYGGQNGGNNTSLTGSTDDGSTANAYSSGINGTSFAAPIVAGGASLVASAAKTLPSLSGNPAAHESVVVKALLMTGADKTSGWTNGQQTVTVGSDTFIRTTQSLDWDVGAGRMNLDTTFDLQVNGQTDVAGTAIGDLGDVLRTGWDYGNAVLGTDNSYVISEWLRGGTTLTASLAWLRNRSFDFLTTDYEDVAQADLNLSVWALDGNDQFTTLIARSESLYNTVEHLAFTLPSSGFYGLRVEYPLNTYDNSGGTWGTLADPQAYALSWQAVPEPAALTLAWLAGAGLTVKLVRRRARPRSAPLAGSQHAMKMSNPGRRVLQAVVIGVGLCLPGVLLAAPQDPIPDFTQGDPIPAGATHDWNLGATGARGWMFSNKLVTTEARQIRITTVAADSPADGLLAVGDVILGVGDRPFSADPRTELGRALVEAEKETNLGRLALIRWRNGTTETVTLQLPVLGSYSPTAPYDCPKSKRILEEGCQALAARVAAKKGQQEPITRSLNALALLASGNSAYLPLVRREVEWAADFSDSSMRSWRYGYVLMLLSEYVLATGDQSVVPGLTRLARQVAQGQSAVGSWGHDFAIADGRLGGYGMMNAPGVPLTISLILARDAGVKDPAIDLAIERSSRLLRFYIGKGAIPYGDHHPWIETHEDNGKCGMAAVMFNQLGHAAGAEYFSRMSLASHGSERDCGHTGNFFNILWALPGVGLSGPQAAGAWMNEFGARSFDLARRWDGAFDHQGPPENEPDSYHNWDASGAILLGYALPLKRLRLTGSTSSLAPQLKAAESASVLQDGRGWTNADRTSFYASLETETLLQRLGSWSIVVRERCAMELARRDDDIVPELVQLLESPELNSRYGACQALARLRGRAAPAVPTLAKSLKHEDLWLRIKSAEALAAIGSAAVSTAPELLAMLASGSTVDDPRGMEQRYLAFALFDSREGLLGRSLDGVDRESLYAAVRAGLRNEDGRARGAIGSVYRNLSSREIAPLLPAIYQAIVKPAPSGEMFADEIRMEGLKLLAKHRIREGINACVDYTASQNPWASEKRTPEIMEILQAYGAQAIPALPELERIAADFEKGEVNFPRHLSLAKAQAVRATMESIRASGEFPDLINLEGEASE